MQLTFEQIPGAIGQLFSKLENIERLLTQRNDLPANESEDLINIKQAALLINLSVYTVYGLVSRSEIPYMKKGKRLYFSKVELNAWIKSGKKKTIAEIANDTDQFLSMSKNNIKA